LTPKTPPVSCHLARCAADRRGRRSRTPQEAYEEQAKVRAIYEELVLKKAQPTVVQIGSVSDIAKSVPSNFANAGKPVSIAPAPQRPYNGNGHSSATVAAVMATATAANKEKPRSSSRRLV